MDRKEPGLVHCGQIWLGLDYIEEGAGNIDKGPVCRTVMYKTFMDLPIQITLYHSALSG